MYWNTMVFMVGFFFFKSFSCQFHRFWNWEIYYICITVLHIVSEKNYSIGSNLFFFLREKVSTESSYRDRYSVAESETIDRECLSQGNKTSGSKKIISLLHKLNFLVNQRGVWTPTDTHLGAAPADTQWSPTVVP
jgi:hypothetical protein